MHNTSIWSGLACVAVACATVDAEAAVPKTYYIDEVTSYPGTSPCSAAPTLNDVTSGLKAFLDNAGFSGQRYTNGSAYLTDFVDSCRKPSQAHDDVYGDAASLTVFAGHANTAVLAFGTPDLGGCQLSPPDHSALGMLGGAKAVTGMFLACEALGQPGPLGSGRAGINGQWLRQALGWSDSIGIGGSEPAEFFEATADTVIPGVPGWYPTITIPAMSNVDAWLGTMDGDGRHPVAITYGTNSAECLLHRTHAQLKSGYTMYHREATTPACVAGTVTSYPSYWIRTEEIL
jgi:hypothetical protein